MKQKQGSPFPEKFLTVLKRRNQYDTKTILENQIIVIPNLLDHDLCKELINSMDKNLKFTTTPLIKSKDYASRVNDRATHYDLTISRLIYQMLLRTQHAIFHDSIGCNPNLRIYKYLPKRHFFGKHYDDDVLVKEVSTGAEVLQCNLKTKWTVLIYLTGGDSLIGGDTVFYNGKKQILVHPEIGMLLLHKHGDDCLLHELLPVAKGVKWVLRTDIL